MNNKVIAIVGPTASGKTSLGIEIAKKYNGEIISADSRQIYKYMKIGTDLPDGRWTNNQYIVKGIPHYIMNFLEPDCDFSLAEFKIKAVKTIDDILKRKKLPIIVGGTGLYISSLVDNLLIPESKPNLELREKLSSMKLEDLVSLLKEKDIQSYNKIDIKNPRRVIRALEVNINTGKSFVSLQKKEESDYNFLQIGIKRDRQEMYRRINERVDQMIKQGLIDEIKSLLNKGYTWDNNSMTGLGYRQFKEYIESGKGISEAIEKLKIDTRHYAKRQLTWFKRKKEICWFEQNSNLEIDEVVQKFLD